MKKLDSNVGDINQLYQMLSLNQKNMSTNFDSNMNNFYSDLERGMSFPNGTPILS